MERFRKILKRLFVLPFFATVLISLPAFALVGYVLASGTVGVLAYASYAVSAYAVVLTITCVIRLVQLIHGGIDRHPLVKKLLRHPFGERYFTDAAFRAEVALYPGLFINLLYAAVKLISGILYHSVWFISLAVYYSLLAVMRFLLLTSARKKQIRGDLSAEFRRYRICGVLLAVMDLALSGMVWFIIRRDGGYEYPGMLIYVMAVYAFYSVITAAVNLVKFRKQGSPILSAAKVIHLTAAFVSMLALETAMLTQFGGDDSAFRFQMIASTGAVICGLVFAMALYMIIRSSKQLKKDR